MKKWLVCCLLLCCSNLSFAESQPLRVAVVAFSPPFAMQSTSEHFYGFDIATIEYVCQHIKRRCEYIPMDFDKLFEALLNEEADVAIGGIIITLQRARMVRFSTPYMVSKAQFITNQDTPIQPPFTLEKLGGKRVGALEGGSLERMIKFSSKKKPNLIKFKQDSDIIDALKNNRIQFAILSAPKAHYWKSNSAGSFKSVGKPFPVGFGFAVAINPRDQELIKKVDLALFDYQDSDSYKENYNLYFLHDF